MNDIEAAVVKAWLDCADPHKGSLTGFACGYRSALAHAARGEGEASANYVRQVPFKGCACAGCLAADPLHHPYLCAACYAKVAPESRWSSVNQPPETSEVEKARRAFYEAARAYVDSVYGDVFQRVPKWHVAAAAYDALLAAERSDPRRGEDGAAIDAQDPMAEYVAASLAWWLDESPEAERMEGETWKRFHRAYYALPVSVRMGAR